MLFFKPGVTQKGHPGVTRGYCTRAIGAPVVTALCRSNRTAIVRVVIYKRLRVEKAYLQGFWPFRMTNCGAAMTVPDCHFRGVTDEQSFSEQVADGLFHHVSADLCNGAGERNVLGADRDAVLRIAAFLNSAVSRFRAAPV